MIEASCDTPAGARRGGVSTLVLGSIWLPFLIFPTLALVHAHISATHRVLALAGAGTFVVIYCAVVAKPERVARTPGALAVSVLLIALAVALTTLDRDGWASLFIYAAAAGALVLPARAAAVHVLAATALAAGLTAAEGAGSSVVLSVAVGSAGIGYLVIAVGQLRARNFELARARTELAELAVATERERFARDLHDLLGHSLSVISLKAQLARRLLASAPAEAETHIADLEQVTREALTEVRDAVSGYRQPTLEAALAAARNGAWGRVVAVFQPHRYTRTAELGGEFGGAFDDADVIVLTDVYGAGEAPIPGVSGRLVADAVRRARPDVEVRYVPGRPDLVAEVGGLLRRGDLCLTLGAGDLTSLPDELMAAASVVSGDTGGPGNTAPGDVAP